MRLLIDWLIAWPERVAKHVHVACSPVCAHHGWLGVFAERLGQAPQFAASDRKFHRLGNSRSRISLRR